MRRSPSISGNHLRRRSEIRERYMRKTSEQYPGENGGASKSIPELLAIAGDGSGLERQSTGRGPASAGTIAVDSIPDDRRTVGANSYRNQTLGELIHGSPASYRRLYGTPFSVQPNSLDPRVAPPGPRFDCRHNASADQAPTPPVTADASRQAVQTVSAPNNHFSAAADESPRPWIQRPKNQRPLTDQSRFCRAES